MGIARVDASARRDAAVDLTTCRIGTASSGIDAGRPIDAYTLACRAGVRVSVWTLGATLAAFAVPAGPAGLRNWLIGLPSLADHQDPAVNRFQLGATLGRYARCVRGGQFPLDGRQVRLCRNIGDHHFHGGPEGFDKRVWAATPRLDATEASVTLSLTSPDGDQGYPGQLTARCIYSLGEDGVLTLRFEAETDAPTLVGLTNHAYWNLSGTDGDLDGHTLCVGADRVVEAGADHMPTGRLLPAATAWPPAATPLAGRALDHCFVLAAAGTSCRLDHPASGRGLEITTDHPALAVHVGRHLPRAGCGVALQPTDLPDAPNHPGFGDTILRPGQAYRRTTRYRATFRPG